MCCELLFNGMCVVYTHAPNLFNTFSIEYDETERRKEKWRKKFMSTYIEKAAQTGSQAGWLARTDTRIHRAIYTFRC